MERADLLSVEDLSIAYLSTPPAFAVNAVSFSVRDNEVLGLVGESGSGKSTLAMGILGLLPRPGRILQGSMFLTELTLLAQTISAGRKFAGERLPTCLKVQ